MSGDLILEDRVFYAIDKVASIVHNDCKPLCKGDKEAIQGLNKFMDSYNACVRDGKASEEFKRCLTHLIDELKIFKDYRPVLNFVGLMTGIGLTVAGSSGDENSLYLCIAGVGIAIYNFIRCATKFDRIHNNRQTTLCTIEKRPDLVDKVLQRLYDSGKLYN